MISANIVDRVDLIDLVLKQIVEDVDNGDLSAIEELISFLPDHVLCDYLPEGAK